MLYIIELKINEMGNQIVPIPIQIWICIENVWLKKEILVSPDRSQNFAQPLGPTPNGKKKHFRFPFYYWIPSLSSCKGGILSETQPTNSVCLL